jgi:rare lipoprotein A
VLVGRATWYGPGFHGRRTASGERFDRNALTLASRGLPMHTVVRVTNLKNGRSAVGRVNDRGPYSHGAIVDLSEALARRVGMGGTTRVKVQILGWRETK